MNNKGTQCAGIPDDIEKCKVIGVGKASSDFCDGGFGPLKGTWCSIGMGITSGLKVRISWKSLGKVDDKGGDASRACQISLTLTALCCFPALCYLPGLLGGMMRPCLPSMASWRLDN